MKKQYIYSAFILTAILSAGCAKEFENTLDGTDGTAIELSSVSTDPMTKAVITGTEFTTSEAEAGIGLFLLDGSGNAYGNNGGNVRYGYSDGKWTAASPLRVGNTEGTLVGYYPYSNTATDVNAIPVVSSINGTDYLFGSIAGLTSAKAKSESLTLSHALTRLKITFKLDNSFVGSGTLSSLTIEGDGIAASGTLDATSGKISATKSAFTVSGLNASISTGLTEDCLVVPASASDTPQAVTLKFTVDGKAYKVDLTDGLAVKLQSGIQTDITLTVKNTSVTVDGSSIGAWGDGGTQTVTVGGDYTVTISLDNGVYVHDVLTDVYVDGNSVIVNASSKSGEHLKCTMPDGELCTSQSKTSNLVYTFTISDITSNTTATIGYAKAVSKFTSVYPNNSGVVRIVGELYEGETVRIVPESAYSYGISCWKDQNNNVLSDGYDYTVRLSQDLKITACFEENLVLGGVFTVAKDDKGNVKKVRFTRGNLYYDGSSKIEQHQYDFNSASYTNSTAHVSHFMWYKTLNESVKKKYEETGTSASDTFFTNQSTFTVDGFSKAGSCFALSDWEYLLTERTASTVNGTTNARYFKGCIQKEDGTSMNGMFIFPDVFTWPSSVKTLPDEINEASSGYDNKYTYNDFKRLQDAGIVFLPAAGFRDGNDGDTLIFSAGSLGFYWSASPDGDFSAFDLNFFSGGVNPGHDDSRRQACSVRLVTESN